MLWLLQQLCKVTCKASASIWSFINICVLPRQNLQKLWELRRSPDDLWEGQKEVGGSMRGSRKDLQPSWLGDYQHSSDRFGHLGEVDTLLACVKGKYGP